MSSESLTSDTPTAGRRVEERPAEEPAGEQPSMEGRIEGTVSPGRRAGKERWTPHPPTPEGIDPRVLSPEVRAPRLESLPDRRIGHLVGEEPGPLLIVVGSLHGNEPAGAEGLRRAFTKLGDGRVLRGELLGLAGNLPALERGWRFLRQDLNRIWFEERLEQVRGGDRPLGPEEEQMAELDREIRRALLSARSAGQPVFMVDLHTTSGGGPSFCVLEDTLPNRELALALEAPLVLGLEEELSGTLANYLVSQGVVAVGFESGQHDDPSAVERAEAAVWLALEATGILEPGTRPEVTEARHRLVSERRGLPRVVDVHYRHAIVPEDRFHMAPGFATFHRVRQGQALAVDRHGTVEAPVDGLLLMPLYQEQGNDGFFVVRKVAPAWLRVSAVVRRWGLERGLHLLPGVLRHPELADAFLVDRRLARFFALQIFHLLGFRRRGPATGRYLVMVRRSHDV